MSPADAPRITSRPNLPLLISAAALAVVVASVLLQAAAPIFSGDAWWHLSLGEAFWVHGPWLQSDPLLFSSVVPPSPHAWLFDLSLSGVEHLFGLRGLRVFHALACLGITFLAYRIFRRGATGPVLALTASALFLTLALDRLVRLRPDLFSISACLMLYQLLLANDTPPSMRRIVASTILFSLWANFHALFALAPILLSVVLCVRLGMPIVARTHGYLPLDLLWIKRLSASIAFGLLAALMNPLGINQHLSFFRSSEGSALHMIADDWTSFSPFSWEAMRGTIAFSSWVIADFVLGFFIVLAIYILVRYLRNPETIPLASLQVPLLGLAAASLIAIAASSRFLWMAFFPILWLVRCLPVFFPAIRGRVFAWGMALLCVGVMSTFPALRTLANLAPARIRAYLERDVNDSYPIEGVKFLSSAALEGNLFGRYSTSGFFGYWLEPRIKTLVNGSMNFPPEVFRDYFAIVKKEGIEHGERFTDILDRRKIDLYFGTGTPTSGTFLYTTADLETHPEWLLIHRGLAHAIYLRRTPHNRKNLERVVDYYAEEGIPFDLDRGFDIGVVLQRHTSWAIGQRMLPTDYPRLMRTKTGNLRVLSQLAIIHLLLGDYPTQIHFDEQSIALAPRARAPRRRLIISMLKLGRNGEAFGHIKLLAAGGDRRGADMLLKLYKKRLFIDRNQGLEAVPRDAPDLWMNEINSLPFVMDSEVRRIKRALLPPPTLKRVHWKPMTQH